MKYQNIKIGTFIHRPNRFIAEVMIDGKTEVVHVKNTGRCKEILIPGTKVILSKQFGVNRKTNYDLIGVEKTLSDGTKILINIDSAAPNVVVEEFLSTSGLFSSDAKIKREVFYKKSRFDFYIEDGDRKAFLEVKGVTLEENGISMFPDAPTERGIKHINELIDAKENGYEAYIFFVIQLKETNGFTPNARTHLAFANALKEAKTKGVNILAYNCNVTYDSLEILKKIPILL